MRATIFALALALTAGWAHAADGQALYEANCMSCHQPDGAGALGLAPPLLETLGARMASPAGRQYVAGVVMSGLAGKLISKGVVYTGVMPGWSQLSDAELAAVVNHVLQAFNAKELPVAYVPYAAETFAALRDKKPTGRELRAWRAESE